MLEMPAMFDHESFLILICELILEVVHMGGGAMVVEIFDDGVQIHVGDVQMIRIGDVLMSLVGDVRMIRLGVGRMTVVGVVLMTPVFGARILGVDLLMLWTMFAMMIVCLCSCFCFCGMLVYGISLIDVDAFVDGFGLHSLLGFRLFGACVFRLGNSVTLLDFRTC
jgi:hypothetical protein